METNSVLPIWHYFKVKMITVLVLTLGIANARNTNDFPSPQITSVSQPHFGAMAPACTFCSPCTICLLLDCWSSHGSKSCHSFPASPHQGLSSLCCHRASHVEGSPVRYSMNAQLIRAITVSIWVQKDHSTDRHSVKCCFRITCAIAGRFHLSSVSQKFSILMFGLLLYYSILVDTW